MAPFTTISSFLLQLAETVVEKIKKGRRVWFEHLEQMEGKDYQSQLYTVVW